jgi:ethanolamine ammonia-lyase large subunit
MQYTRCKSTPSPSTPSPSTPSPSAFPLSSPISPQKLVLRSKHIGEPKPFNLMLTSDSSYYRMTWGKANQFKEGDQEINLAATSDDERKKALEIISTTRLEEIKSLEFIDDEVSSILEQTLNHNIAQSIGSWTFMKLKNFLLDSSELEIKKIMPGLRSEVIAGVSKLMNNEDLIQVASKIYNNYEGQTLGAFGYFGSRIQPNSPTDDPEEVLFSVLEGLSYGCGDAIFGINIVAGDLDNVKCLENTLKDVITTFKLGNYTKWCVLAHIDDQIEVEKQFPGSVDCAFQSIGGNSEINSVFNLDVFKLQSHLSKVKAQYFETGQGSAVTNKADCGIDMNGLARALSKQTGNWTIINTVAGFIGPEVFKTRDQLLRACLEDLFMGKLHGLIFGLDICSTYHMSLELGDFDYLLDKVMEAGPAFYMAVAGRNDPMLSYLTTSYRDHPRLRKKHNKKVTDELQKFFINCGLMKENGEMTNLAGDTEYMYFLYKREKGDTRSEGELRKEARTIIEKLQKRGLDLGFGHDGNFQPPIFLQKKFERIYSEAKKVIHENLSTNFTNMYKDNGDLMLCSNAKTRNSYLFQPSLGEVLSDESVGSLNEYRRTIVMNKINFQFVISEGLNPTSIETEGHLAPFLLETRSLLSEIMEANVFDKNIFIENGRVRAGYHVGQLLFGDFSKNNNIGCIIHCIGERPGNGKDTFSAYISLAETNTWSRCINHNVVKVVCGISHQALPPQDAASKCLDIIKNLLKDKA